MADGIRIQKALADAGICSRRAAEAMVAAGRVTVNGEAALVGQRVHPQRDLLVVDGHPVPRTARRVYLRMYKPAGVTSTVRDRHAERTVLDLVPSTLRSGARLYPVGRLDRESEGLLLLTNDGDWAQRLLHPRHEVEREYQVGLVTPLDASQADLLAAGIDLEEGRARLVTFRAASRAEAARLDGEGARHRLTWYRAVITQGWKRQLRRMFSAIDAPVTRLVRVRVGTLRLDGMAVGEVRQLTAAERTNLLASARDTGRP